jgi:hypothetical protein
MPSTSWKNHAPAMVTDAIAQIASAIQNARDCADRSDEKTASDKACLPV